MSTLGRGERKAVVGLGWLAVEGRPEVVVEVEG